MSADGDLRAMFAETFPAPTPSADQRDQARSALNRAIRAGQHAAPVRPHRWRRRAVALAGVAAAVAVVLALPQSTPEVDANLADIARATREIPAAELPAGSYFYAHIDSVTLGARQTDAGNYLTYRLPESIDLWVRDGFATEQRAIGRPSFEDPADEAEYYAAGYEASDGVGERFTRSYTDIPNQATIAGLSADVTTLREQLLAELSQNPDFSPQDHHVILQHVAQLMEPRLDLPPALRAAMIELLAELDVTTAATAAGGVVVEILYTDDSGSYLQQLEFDGAGHLRLDRLALLEAAADSDSSPGLIAELRFSVPGIVTGPGDFPAG